MDTKKILLLFFIVPFIAHGQGGWSWQETTPMPMATSNNGLAAATVNDTVFVYSFAGLDTSKIYTGIHTKSFRYNTVTEVWDTIPDLPDSLGGIIALSATTIRNKIYIVGGYHVYADDKEVSTPQLHIYDPDSNTYARGPNIPVAIDDHVHFSYMDSLLYIITGWTSELNPPWGLNTNEVQIYDVVNDVWLEGTDVPQNNTYMAFGASGGLIGDTIYYAGGAVNGSFSLSTVLRKGVIDPQNPTQITWSADTNNPGEKIYRSAAVSMNNRMFWIGGAGTPYNYDGIAYSGGFGVEPTRRILEWIPSERRFYENDSTPFGVMDLRNIAQISPNQFVIAGGMLENQTVSRKTFLLTYDTTFTHPPDSSDTLNLAETHRARFKIYPNPSTGKVDLSHLPEAYDQLSVYTYDGRLVKALDIRKQVHLNLDNGRYMLVLEGDKERKICPVLIRR